jgi:hypothetical protein
MDHTRFRLLQTAGFIVAADRLVFSNLDTNGGGKVYA